MDPSHNKERYGIETRREFLAHTKGTIGFTFKDTGVKGEYQIDEELPRDDEFINFKDGSYLFLPDKDDPNYNPHISSFHKDALTPAVRVSEVHFKFPIHKNPKKRRKTGGKRRKTKNLRNNKHINTKRYRK